MVKEQKMPGKWFNGVIYDKGDIVANRFTGEEIELNNVELSIYDFCIGASIVIEMGMFNTPRHVQDLRKGLEWFMKYNPEAYMILLD